MNNMNVDYVTLHYRSVLNDFSNQFLNEEFSDCVLNAEGKSIKVHRAMLCAQSSFLEKLVLEHQNIGELCFIVEGVSFEHLNLVVQFMYNGSTKLNKNNFGPFLVVAELLGVKWLDCIQILSDTESSAPYSNAAVETDPTNSTVQDNTETQSTSVTNNVASSVFKNITNVLDSKLVKRKKHMKGKKHCKRSKCAREDRNERKKHKSLHSFRHDHSKLNDKVIGKETHLGDMDEHTFCTALGLKKNVEVLPRELNSKPESASVETDQKILAKTKSVPPLIKINRDVKSNVENFEARDSNLFVSEINTVYIEDKNLSFLNIGANELCIRENNIEIECDVLDASSSQFVIEKEAAGEVVEIREENIIQAEFVDINPENTSEKEHSYCSTPFTSSALPNSDRPVLVLRVKDANKSNVVFWYPSKENFSGNATEEDRSYERNVIQKTTLRVQVPNLNIPQGAIVEEDSLMKMIPNESSDVDDRAITPPCVAYELRPSTPGISNAEEQVPTCIDAETITPAVPDEQSNSGASDSTDSEEFVSAVEDETSYSNEEVIPTIFDEKAQLNSPDNERMTYSTNDTEEMTSSVVDNISPITVAERTTTDTVDAAEIASAVDEEEAVPPEVSDDDMPPLAILDSDGVSTADEEEEPLQNTINDEMRFPQSIAEEEESLLQNQPIEMRSAPEEEARSTQSATEEKTRLTQSVLEEKERPTQSKSEEEVRPTQSALEEEAKSTQSAPSEEAIALQSMLNEIIVPSQSTSDEETRPSCSHYSEQTSLTICVAKNPSQPPHIESIANKDKEMEADCGVQPLPEVDEVVKLPPVIIRPCTRQGYPLGHAPSSIIQSKFTQKKQSLELRHQSFVYANEQGSVVYQIPIPKSVNLRKSPRFMPRKSIKKPGLRSCSQKHRYDSYQDYLTRTFNLKPFVIKLTKFRNEKEKKESEKMSFLSNFNLKKRGISPITEEHSYVIHRELKECSRPKRKYTSIGNVVKRKSMRLTPKNVSSLKSVTVELEKLDDAEVRRRVRREHSYNFNSEDSQLSSELSITL